MNSQTHRVIFNKSRGCMMAVSEVAGSIGSGNSSKSAESSRLRLKRFKHPDLSISSLPKLDLGHFDLLHTLLAQSIRVQAAPVSIVILSSLNAGRDLNLSTVTTSLSIQGTSRGRRSSSSMSLQTSEELGTTIQAQGDIGLSAGQDIAIRAGQVQSSQGALSLSAGRDIAITEGRQTFSLATTNQSSSRSTFRRSSTNQANSSQTNTSVESSLGGRTIALDAGRDILLRGANVVSDTGTRLAAGNNITIEAAQNTASTSSFIETKQSGLMGSGGAGVFIGNKQQSTREEIGVRPQLNLFLWRKLGSDPNWEEIGVRPQLEEIGVRHQLNLFLDHFYD